MHRSYEYDYHRSSSRYYSALSNEHLDRLERIQRMPTMIAGTPYFPNIHEVLNNQHVPIEENYDHRKKKKSDKNKKSDKTNHQKKNHQSSEGPKKVHFAENEKKVEVTRDGKHDAREEKSVDDKADGFIKQKHKGFELCKWDTFRVY